MEKNEQKGRWLRGISKFVIPIILAILTFYAMQFLEKPTRKQIAFRDLIIKLYNLQELQKRKDFLESNGSINEKDVDYFYQEVRKARLEVLAEVDNPYSPIDRAERAKIHLLIVKSARYNPEELSQIITNLWQKYDPKFSKELDEQQRLVGVKP